MQSTYPAPVTIPAGETRVTFSIALPDDEELEPFSRFRIAYELLPGITADGVTFGQRGAERIILYDNEWHWIDPRLQVATVEEGESITVTPTLGWYAEGRPYTPSIVIPSHSPTAAANITMEIAVHLPSAYPPHFQDPLQNAEPATSGTDFTLPAQVTILAGGDAGSFEIRTTDDSQNEETECFFLELIAVSGRPPGPVHESPVRARDPVQRDHLHRGQ